MSYEARWYDCEFGEVDESSKPEFSRVPEHKRAEVERRWRERSFTVARWRLWGPQIESYAALPNVTVKVLGPA